MENVFLSSLQEVFSFQVLGLLALGVALGIIYGGLPGISSSMGVALMLPFTYTMSLNSALALLIGLYIGGVSGGLITAILINIPGTPASIATCWDGYPMTKRGEGGKALGIGLLYSFLGGILSLVILYTISPVVAIFALKFGAVEYFAVVFFSLALIATLSGKSLAKGIVSAMLGAALTTVGASPIDGALRFTFGFHGLDGGFQLVPVMVGVFAVSEVLKTAVEDPEARKLNEYRMHGFGISIKEFKSQLWNYIRSALIGVGIGILPGIGGGISNILAYSVAKQQSKYPEKFGTGIIDGIVASETANNATTGGALIPMLTVGIPGDVSTAIFLGALMVQGITPGPLMFKNNMDVVYIIFIIVLLANIFMIIIEYFGLPLILKVLLVPGHILLPIVLVICVVGAFTSNNRVFDVWAVIFFAVLGYGMQKFKYPLAPFVLGYILGGLVEVNLRRGLQTTRGNVFAFMQKPIAAVFIIITFIFIGIVLRGRKKNAALQSGGNDV
jgi:putative tricarboxylic transport membrane protein